MNMNINMVFLILHELQKGLDIRRQSPTERRKNTLTALIDSGERKFIAQKDHSEKMMPRRRDTQTHMAPSPKGPS